MATHKQERYHWVHKILVKHPYMRLNKLNKGLITRDLMKVTGYYHSQIKRLMQQYVKIGIVRVKMTQNNGFQRRYSEADIQLLAHRGEQHRQPSGPHSRSSANESISVLTKQNINHFSLSPVQSTPIKNLLTSALHLDQNTA